MPHQISRSISEPKRENLSWNERWRGPDKGLITCWERGREMRVTNPILAERAREMGDLDPGFQDWLDGKPEGTR